MPTWLPLLLLPSVIGAQVRIELPGATPVELAAAQRGCEKALGRERCSVTGEVSAGVRDAGPKHQAQVRWRVDPPTAQIRFSTRTPAGATESESRQLTFTEGDEVSARFEAIGLVVAAYVMGRSFRGGQEVATSPRGPAPVDDSPRWATDLLFGAGPALDRGGPRLSLGLRAAFRPLNAPLFLMIEGAAARRFDAVDVMYGSGGLGVALWLSTPWPVLDLQVHLSGVAEYVSVTATHPETGERASAGRLRLGARLGVEALVCPFDNLCVVGGVRLNSLHPSVRVEILGQAEGTQEVLGIDGVLGIRLSG